MGRVRQRVERLENVDPISTSTIWDAKGDLAVGSAADAASRLGIGANGTVLTADSGETLGMKWATGGITALTGDVTATGPGSAAATIANDAVTYAKMQNVSATDKVLGRSTAGAGDVEEIPCTASGRAIIAAASVAAQQAILAPPRVQTVASASTVTPAFTNDLVRITAQAAPLTIANPSGTAMEGFGITIRIKDDGTARAITFGGQYRAIGTTLPATTVISKTLYLRCVWNDSDTKLDVIQVAQEV